MQILTELKPREYTLGASLLGPNFVSNRSPSAAEDDNPVVKGVSSGFSIAQAVWRASESVADSMGLEDRGRLESDLRADFVVMDDEACVLESWVGGKLIWQRDQALGK